MITAGLTVLVVYLAFGAGLYVYQRNFIYLPSGDLHDSGPGGPPLSSIIKSETSDGLLLEHFLIPSGDPAAPVVVVFHGNAGNAAERWPKYSSLVAEGFGLVLAEYRGYGGNPGEPSEAGLIEDGRALLETLRYDFRIHTSRVILYGESLGAGVVTALAADHPVRGLILEGAFTSLPDMAQRAYPLYPARWLVKDQFDNVAKLREATAPIMVIHGLEDEVVPVSHAQALLSVVSGEVESLLIEEAGHNNLSEFGVMRHVADFAERLLPRY